MTPEVIVDTVMRELAGSNPSQFKGSFNSLSLQQLMTFLKSPQEGIKLMLIGLQERSEADLSLISFWWPQAYEIAHYEVVQALEQKIAVEQRWIDALESSDKSGELRPAAPFRAITVFLKRLPRWNGMDIDA